VRPSRPVAPVGKSLSDSRDVYTRVPIEEDWPSSDGSLYIHKVLGRLKTFLSNMNIRRLIEAYWLDLGWTY
jgi:hypothetical protein